MNCDYISSQAIPLSQNYSRNPFEAAESFGIVISYKDLGTLKGLFLSSTPKPAIVINNTLDDDIKKIVCAHELGHFILHKNADFSCESTCFDTKTSIGKLEREANIFAAIFLIDKCEALSLLKNGYSAYEAAAVMKTDANLLFFLLNAIGVCDAPDSQFLK